MPPSEAEKPDVLAPPTSALPFYRPTHRPEDERARRFRDRYQAPPRPTTERVFYSLAEAIDYIESLGLETPESQPTQKGVRRWLARRSNRRTE